MSRKTTLTILLILAVPQILAAQRIVSAEEFFSDLSTTFGTIKDYMATVTFTQGKGVSRGRLYYKSPLFLRIDFDAPPRQVINFDGEKLTVYDPSNNVTLEQAYKKKTPSQLDQLLGARGLSILQRNYSVAYLVGPDPVPLEEGSKDMVVKLRLTSRGTTGYSEMIISVKDGFYRRIEATPINGDKWVWDFTNVKMNQGIPDSRFNYDSPPDANVISDWLFDSEQ